MLIRDAKDEDWDAIWPFFREIVRAQETYAYESDTSYDEGRALWMEKPPSRTAVALDDDGTVLGSSKMGPNRPGPGAHIGTASFMVSRQAQGRGVGRALAEDMVRWHRANGFHGIAGHYARQSLLSYADTAEHAAVQVRRRDTGASVAVELDLSSVPAPANLRPLLGGALDPAASAEQRAAFGRAWQERVQCLLLEHADDPDVILLHRLDYEPVH